MGVLLAALSAALYGSADFMGGMAARRARPLGVTWGSQIVGLVCITLTALVVGADRVVVEDWVWGGAGGIAGSCGLLLLYRALAQGPMTIVAPVTALCSAMVPVVVGLAQGDRPSPLAVVGIVAAVPAVVLVAGIAESSPVEGAAAIEPRVVAESVLAGAMFGLFFVFIAEAGDGAGMWPTVAARAASVTMLGLAVLTISTVARSSPARPDGSPLAGVRDVWWVVAGAGVLDVAANAVFLLASREAMLSEVSVVAAMYPAATVVLAWLLLRERLSRPQGIGLALAAASVGLVAAG